MKPTRSLPILRAVISNALFISATGLALARTAPEAAPSQTAVTTQIANSEIVYVSGNNLVLRLEDGTVEHFLVSDDWRFKVDGKELAASELQPGTKITTTIVSTGPPDVVRTTSIRSGTVTHAQGNTVIVRMDDTQENERFVVPEFIVNGEPADVHHLRKGMHITASNSQTYQP